MQDSFTRLFGNQRSYVKACKGLNWVCGNLNFVVCMVNYSSSAKFFLSSCICGLLDNRIVVLVTHQIQFALPADKILLLKKARPYVVTYTTSYAFMCISTPSACS